MKRFIQMLLLSGFLIMTGCSTCAPHSGSVSETLFNQPSVPDQSELFGDSIQTDEF